MEENGVMQAQAAGEFLRRFYEQRIQEGEKPKIMAYTSCYKRARQTLAEIDKKMNGLIERTQDHILLGEQDFGSFEGTGAVRIRLECSSLFHVQPQPRHFRPNPNVLSTRFTGKVEASLLDGSEAL